MTTRKTEKKTTPHVGKDFPVAVGRPKSLHCALRVVPYTEKTQASSQSLAMQQAEFSEEGREPNDTRSGTYVTYFKQQKPLKPQYF